MTRVVTSTAAARNGATAIATITIRIRKVAKVAISKEAEKAATIEVIFEIIRPSIVTGIMFMGVICKAAAVHHGIKEIKAV